MIPPAVQPYIKLRSTPPMSANDKVVLDNEFTNWRESRAGSLDKKVDPFAYYSIDLVLRKFAPTDEDILAGWTDGEDDGGADGIYLIGNKNTFITEDTEPSELKGITTATLVVVQVKRSEGGFEEGELRKLKDLLGDLVDSSRDEAAYSVRYNSRVLRAIRTFRSTYREVGTTSFSLSVEYHYVVNRDGMTPNAKVLSFADECRQVVRAAIGKATFEAAFVNAEALVQIIQRRAPKEKELHWAEPAIDINDNFLGLVRLDKFYEFISNSDGELEERLFDSNVRGFQDETHVNQQIQESLSGGSDINFWLLNNGVTILAEDATRTGKKVLLAKDPQIVNGLQTSRVIHRHFQNREKVDDRLVLVRVIKTTDTAVRDAVIRATNSQNKMSPASLRATHKIHHDIEYFFRTNGLCYDRRKGYYKDRGEPIDRIVSIMDVVKAGVAVLLGRPDDARARPGGYITVDAKYEKLFDDNIPAKAYLVCIKAVKRVDALLDSMTELEASYKLNVRYYVAARLVWDITESHSPAAKSVAEIDMDGVGEKELGAAYKAVVRPFDKLGGNDSAAKGTGLLKAILVGPKRRLVAASKRSKRV